MSKFFKTTIAAAILVGCLYVMSALVGGWDGTEWNDLGKFMFLMLSISIAIAVFVMNYFDDNSYKI